MTILARTVIHPEEGVSKPLYLGKVQRSLSQQRDDSELDIEVFSSQFSQLPTDVNDDTPVPKVN
jgi:hypothetical protein